MMAQLRAILRRLNAAGIPVILLKGAALIETVYQRAALRPMSDLDLLVRREDVARVVETLGSLGFSPDRYERRDGALSDFENEIMLSKTKPPGGLVEIHWSLLDSPHHQARIAMDWFWQTARECEVGQARAGVLSPEALLLHLCAHGWLQHHGASRLLWLHDVAEVLARYHEQIDWGVVIDRARQYDMVLALRETLMTMVRDWGACIPDDALLEVRDMEPSHGECAAVDRLAAAQRSSAAEFWYDLAAMSDWRARCAYAGGALVPSATYMRWRYSVRAWCLVPLYYPYRWILALRGLVGSARLGHPPTEP